MFTSEVFHMAAEVLDVKPSKKTMDRIRSRITGCKCLLCDEHATRRGLCVSHYFAYRRARASMSRAEQTELDTRSVRAGKILPVGYSRQVKKPNPFLE